jgi:L-rhamnose mutarotase
VAGWGGDAYAFYLNKVTDEVTFVFDAVWDTSDDANEFADAFVRYADQRWEASETRILEQLTWAGDETVTSLVHEGKRTIWVMSPNATLVESILRELQ